MSKIKKESLRDLNPENDQRKYFKKSFLYGSIGVGIGIADYMISGKLGVESLFKSFNEMNPHEFITNLYSGISSIAALGGGIMYGVSYLFDEEEKIFSKEEVMQLERKLKD